MRENHDRRLHKAHVELSTEMQNLKGGKGKKCVFYQIESCVRILPEDGKTTNITRTKKNNKTV